MLPLARARRRRARRRRDRRDRGRADVRERPRDADRSGEAYIFPLPDRAPAPTHRFRMEVGGRVVEGVVEERAAAREHYVEAVAAGHRAAITEEERAGVFTLRVGNLLPGEAATVRLSLVGPLPVDDGEVTFHFPLVVAPRYIPRPHSRRRSSWPRNHVARHRSSCRMHSRISPPVYAFAGLLNPVRLGIRRRARRSRRARARVELAHRHARAPRRERDRGAAWRAARS